MESREAFLQFADSQFDSTEKRFAQLAADPDVLDILVKISPDSLYHKEFIALEEIAIQRYGLPSVNALKLVIDHWEIQKLKKASSDG